MSYNQQLSIVSANLVKSCHFSVLFPTFLIRIVIWTTCLWRTRRLFTGERLIVAGEKRIVAGEKLIVAGEKGDLFVLAAGGENVSSGRC